MRLRRDCNVHAEKVSAVKSLVASRCSPPFFAAARRGLSTKLINARAEGITQPRPTRLVLQKKTVEIGFNYLKGSEPSGLRLTHRH